MSDEPVKVHQHDITGHLHPVGQDFYMSPIGRYVRVEDVDRLVREAWEECVQHSNLRMFNFEFSATAARLLAMKG